MGFRPSVLPSVCPDASALTIFGEKGLYNSRILKRSNGIIFYGVIFLPINCIKTQLNCYIGPMRTCISLWSDRCKAFNMQLEIRKLLYNLPNTSSHTLINDQLFPKSSFEMLKITVKSPAPYCTSFF